jgi:hypothetical protein
MQGAAGQARTIAVGIQAASLGNPRRIRRSSLDGVAWGPEQGRGS